MEEGDDDWEMRFSNQPPRLVRDGADSRYGPVAQGAAGELAFKGETLIEARQGAAGAEVKVLEALRNGEQDLFLISASGPGDERRYHVLAISPDAAPRLSAPFGPASTLHVTAVTDRGYTVQVPTGLSDDGSPVGYTCFDYRAGEITQRSCPTPLTRADDRRTRPPGEISLASCRSPLPRIIKRQGLDTARASITARHTLGTALNWCQFMADYERHGEQVSGEDLAACAEQILSKKQSWTARADCTRGTIVDVHGAAYRYGGQGPTRMGGVADLWFDAATGEELAPACATNYDAVVDQFTALCPKASGALLLRR